MFCIVKLWKIKKMTHFWQHDKNEWFFAMSKLFKIFHRNKRYELSGPECDFKNFHDWNLLGTRITDSVTEFFTFFKKSSRSARNKFFAKRKTRFFVIFDFGKNYKAPRSYEKNGSQSRAFLRKNKNLILILVQNGSKNGQKPDPAKIP